MSLPGVDLQSFVVGLLGLGMFVKGLAEKARAKAPCIECPLTDKIVEGIEDMIDAHVGPRAIDPSDGQYRWYARDLGKEAVKRQVRVAKESHDDHEQIVRMLGVLLTRSNGGYRGTD